MKIAAVIASVLALSATSAFAWDGNCPSQTSASANVKDRVTTASVERPASTDANAATVVAQTTVRSDPPVIVSE